MFWPSDETSQTTLEVFFIPADFKFLLDISWGVNIFIRCMHARKRDKAVCVGAVGKKWDGFCPFWSGGQVWADNCRACAAETDDYRVYCLSQAQSTLPHVPDSAHSLPLDLWGLVALSLTQASSWPLYCLNSLSYVRSSLFPSRVYTIFSFLSPPPCFFILYFICSLLSSTYITLMHRVMHISY